MSEPLDLLKIHHPTGPWQVLAIEGDRGLPIGRTFAADEEGDLREWIEQRNGRANIYFSLATLFSPMGKKATREDVKAITHLHVDLDARAGEDRERELARMLRLLTDKLPDGVPEPTTVWCSGNGYWATWKLSEPFRIDGDRARYELAAAYNKQLGRCFEVFADSCFNVDRIARLAGTVNLPTATKRKKGYPESQAYLVFHNPERVYPLDRFVPVAEPTFHAGTKPSVISYDDNTPYISDKIRGRALTKDQERMIRELVTYTPGTLPLPQLSPGLEIHANVGAAGAQVEGDPFGEVRVVADLDRSQETVKFAGRCIREGLPVGCIVDLLLDEERKISAHVVDQKNPLRAALRAVASAIVDMGEVDNPTSPDEWLSALNAQYAVVQNFRGKCMVMHEHTERIGGVVRPARVFTSFRDFENAWCNRSVEVTLGEKTAPVPVGKWWLRNPKRRQFRDVVFAPGGTVSTGSYNLWRGFAIDPDPSGDCSMYLAHTRDVICSGDPKVYAYVLGWMAKAVQSPELPGYTAIVLRGKPGTGKNSFVEPFGGLFGCHYLQVSNPDHVVGKFSAHLEDCSVLFANEAFWDGSRRAEAVLKSLITEGTMVTEGKGVNAKQSNNFLHILLAGNREWIVPAQAGERRFVVLDVPDTRMQDSAYFTQLARSMRDGGSGALLHFLLNYDLTTFNIWDIPRTRALREQQMHGLGSMESWWLGKLMDGVVFPNTSEWPRLVPVPLLTSNFLEHCNDWSARDKGTQTRLGMFLKRVLPSVRKLRASGSVDVINSHGEKQVVDRPFVYELPSLEDCRKHWIKEIGDVVDPWTDGVVELPEQDF